VYVRLAHLLIISLWCAQKYAAQQERGRVKHQLKLKQYKEKNNRHFEKDTQTVFAVNQSCSLISFFAMYEYVHEIN